MAEAVGLAASILQLAGAGTKLSIALYNFTNSAAHADRDVKYISDDVELTINALESVGKVFQTQNAEFIVSKKAIQDANNLIRKCEDVFKEISGIVEKRMRTDKDGKRSLSVRGILSYPMKEPRIELNRRRLESLKNSLMLLLHVLQLAQSQARGKTDKSVMEEGRDKIRELHQRQQDSLYILQALESKFRNVALGGEESLPSSTATSRAPTLSLMSTSQSTTLPPLEKKSKTDANTITIDLSAADDSDTSDSDATTTDDHDDHLSIEELARCAEHVQKLLKRIALLQQDFNSSRKTGLHGKRRVQKMYQRFCRKFESGINFVPAASVPVQNFDFGSFRQRAPGSERGNVSLDIYSTRGRSRSYSSDRRRGRRHMSIIYKRTERDRDWETRSSRGGGGYNTVRDYKVPDSSIEEDTYESNLRLVHRETHERSPSPARTEVRISRDRDVFPREQQPRRIYIRNEAPQPMQMAPIIIREEAPQPIIIRERALEPAYCSNDDVYIHKEKDTWEGSETKTKRDIATGALAGVAAGQIVRHHRRSEATGSHLGNALGYGTLGAVSAVALDKCDNRDRSRSCSSGSYSSGRGRGRTHKSRSRSKSRHHSESGAKQLGTLGGIPGAAAYAAEQRRNEKKKNKPVKEETVTVIEDYYRSRTHKSRSRSKSRHRSESRAKQRGTLAAIAGVGALAYAAGQRNRNKPVKEETVTVIEYRHRSRTRSERGRRRSKSASTVSERSRSRSASKHLDAEHRNTKVAQTGLATVAVAGLVQHRRSKSRKREGEGKRSPSRVRQGVPITAAGATGAAITGLYERHKAKEARDMSKSRSRSRSRSVLDRLENYDGETSPNPRRNRNTEERTDFGDLGGDDDAEVEDGDEDEDNYEDIGPMDSRPPTRQESSAQSRKASVDWGGTANVDFEEMMRREFEGGDSSEEILARPVKRKRSTYESERKYRKIVGGKEGVLEERDLKFEEKLGVEERDIVEVLLDQWTVR